MKINTNKIAYAMAYFSQGVYGTFWSVYLPVYLQNLLNLNNILVLIIALLSNLPVLFKPLLNMFGEKYPIKGFKRKYYVTLGSFIFIISTFIAGNIPTVEYIAFFAGLLFCAYLGSSLFDVSLDGLMVNTMHESKNRVKTIVLFMFFSNMGGMFVFLGIPQLTQIMSLYEAYLTILVMTSILGIPLFIISFLLKEEPVKREKTIDKKDINIDNNGTIENNTNGKNITLFIIFATIFALFLNGDRMSDWVMESFLVGKFTQEVFDTTYSFWAGIISLFSTLGYFAAPLLVKKGDNLGIKAQKILIVLLVVFGIHWIIFPFLDLIPLLIMLAIIYFLGGIAYIEFIDVFMIISQNLGRYSKNTTYQILCAIYAGGTWIAVPIGLIFSFIIPQNMVLILCSIPSFISAIAVFFMQKILIKLKKIEN